MVDGVEDEWVPGEHVDAVADPGDGSAESFGDLVLVELVVGGVSATDFGLFYYGEVVALKVLLHADVPGLLFVEVVDDRFDVSPAGEAGGVASCRARDGDVTVAAWDDEDWVELAVALKAVGERADAVLILFDPLKVGGTLVDEIKQDVVDRLVGVGRG